MVAHFRIFNAYVVDLQDVGTGTVTGSCGGAARALSLNPQNRWWVRS
jgi:hypothetical protein